MVLTPHSELEAAASLLPLKQNSAQGWANSRKLDGLIGQNYIRLLPYLVPRMTLVLLLGLGPSQGRYREDDYYKIWRTVAYIAVFKS